MTDIVLDAIIKEAVIANFRDEMNAMPSEEELRKKFAPSPEHVRKMKKLFAWEKRRDFRKKAMPITKAAAIILCVATTVLFGILLTSSEVRAAVHGTIVRFFEGFAQVEFPVSETPETPDSSDSSKGSSDTTPRVATDFTLGFIPEDYVLLNSEELGYGIFAIYGDSEGNLLFFEIQPPGSPAGDIDNRDYRVEIHLGIVYHIFEANDSDFPSTITWVQDNFMFGLIGVIAVDELLEMALSLE